MLGIRLEGLCCDLGSVDYVVILWFVVDCSFMCDEVVLLLSSSQIPTRSSILIQSVQQFSKESIQQDYVLFKILTQDMHRNDHINKWK